MSKPLVVSIPHQLGKAQARARIEHGFARFGDQFGGAAESFRQSWAGDRLTFGLRALGQEVSGHLDVFDQEVRIEVLLPGMLGLIAGKIGGRLRKEGQILLEKK
jgi:putative polyhydroxyalkanoate system protein